MRIRPILIFMPSSNLNYITLNTGAKMPMVGLGTWKSASDKVGQAISCAILECGYRHIDCASVYHNEMEIGESFKNIFSSGKVKREDVFVTSKLWNVSHAKNDVLLACKKTLKDLQLDYLDLYLMHWGIAEAVGSELPVDQNGRLNNPKISVRETWEAMEDLIRAGLVKAVGVANFTAPMLVDLLSYAKIFPAVNQIELHPYLQQTRLVEFYQRQGIVVTAYSPLGTPENARAQGNEPILLEDETVVVIAQNHKKTPAQVLIRWAIQRKTVVIPKSVTLENIKSNGEVFDFELSGEEMEKLARLERHHRFVDPYEWWKIPYFE